MAIKPDFRAHVTGQRKFCPGVCITGKRIWRGGAKLLWRAKRRWGSFMWSSILVELSTLNLRSRQNEIVAWSAYRLLRIDANLNSLQPTENRP
jgi:hypothetical protein